jgi:hypothetical protein
VSPWAQPGHNSSVHASYPALFRTIETILGVDAMNRFDENAPIIWDAFIADPKPEAFRPFTAECARVPLDAINPSACDSDSSCANVVRASLTVDGRPDIDRIVWRAVTESETGNDANSR